MGKGGCDFIDRGIGCIRAVIGCLCCLVCIGPILLIVGIVMLVSPNHYQEYVDSYNSAVKLFNSDYRNSIQKMTGTINSNNNIYTIQASSSGTTTPLSPQYTASIPTASNTNGVTADAASYPLRTTSNIYLGSQASVSLQLDNRNNIAVAGGSIQYLNTTVPALKNYTDSFSIYCSSSDREHNRLCSTLCQNKNSCAEYSGGSSRRCYSSSSCSSGCTVKQYQTMFCQTFSIDNTTGVLSQKDTTARGCIYPFAINGNVGQPSSCSPTSGGLAPVVFLNDKDPFIRAQEIVGSSDMSFGLTAAQQRGVGVGLMITGIFITAIVIGVCYFLFRYLNKNEQSKARVYSAFGQTYIPANGGANQRFSAQMYGQQPPAQNLYDTDNKVYVVQPLPHSPVLYPGYSAAPPPQQQQQQTPIGYGVPPPPQQQNTTYVVSYSTTQQQQAPPPIPPEYQQQQPQNMGYQYQQQQQPPTNYYNTSGNVY